MKGENFDKIVDQIVKEDERYGKGAYFFIRQAIEFTFKRLTEKNHRPLDKHVTGKELLEGIRDYALEQYGIMTLSIFNHWRISQCADFGEIVFNLIEKKIFSKSPHDQKDDFKEYYDFHETFIKPFMPGSKE